MSSLLFNSASLSTLSHFLLPHRGSFLWWSIERLLLKLFYAPFESPTLLFQNLLRIHITNFKFSIIWKFCGPRQIVPLPDSGRFAYSTIDSLYDILITLNLQLFGVYWGLSRWLICVPMFLPYIPRNASTHYPWFSKIFDGHNYVR